MNKRTTRWAIGGLVAMTLLAAACGSDDKSSDTAAPTTAASATTAGSATTAASATTAGGATTTAGSATTAKPATTAAGSAAGTAPVKVSGTLQGSGSTLQGAYQARGDRFVHGRAIWARRSRTAVAARARAAPTCRPRSSTSPAPTPPSRTRTVQAGASFVYVPTVVAPITVSYNRRRSRAAASADTIAKIFQGAITKWNDPAIAADNAGVDLPRRRSRRRPPRRRLGNHRELLQVPRAPSAGPAEAGAEAAGFGAGVAVDTQAGDGNSGVAQIAQAPTGRSATSTSPTRRQQPGVRRGQEQGGQVRAADSRRPPPRRDGIKVNGPDVPSAGRQRRRVLPDRRPDLDHRLRSSPTAKGGAPKASAATCSPTARNCPPTSTTRRCRTVDPGQGRSRSSTRSAG